METDLRKVQKTGWAVLVLGVVTAVAIAGPEKHVWHVPPGRLLFVGFVGFVVLNIGVFCLNVFLSMPKWLKAKTEEELERVAVPALEGEPTEIGIRTARFIGLLVSACVGIIVGAIGVLVARRVF